MHFQKIEVPATYVQCALKFEMTTNVMHYVQYFVDFRGEYVYQNQIQQLRKKI